MNRLQAGKLLGAPQRPAFTLVELLVVIAIIAVLIGLLYRRRRRIGQYNTV